MAYLKLAERMIIPTYWKPEHMTLGQVAIDHEKCNGCGICVSICPGKALRMDGTGENKKAYISDDDFPTCMACSDCAAICERDAITAKAPYAVKYFYKTIHRGELAPPRRF